MASKTETKTMVAKVLRAYPQLKFSAESIQGFVDLLADKLKNYPGWLMDTAADRFIETEIDFPKFNIASILSYCYRVRDEKTQALKDRLQSIKDNWYVGEPCKREDMEKIAAMFDKLGCHEWAESVRERIDTYTRLIKPAAPEKIAESTRRVQASWTEGK